jgi:dinuclear metal center YbgI/SA1388 family protein
VHHGYFWRGEDPRLVGMKRRRLAFLLKHDLNLLAYHLPLDAHLALGNNAQLALKLGFVQEGVFGDQDLGQYGILPDTQPLGPLAARIGEKLGRPPLVIGEPAREVRRIAWCTGAAQGYFQDALSLGIDAFLTGEISEQSVHMARETGVAFISAGHHATEKFGIQALGEHLHRQFGLDHQFIDIPNPV